VEPTADGGYVLAGQTYSFGAPGGSVWVLKVDTSGNVIWQKTYGGTAVGYSNSAQPTADGGYVVAGNSFDDAGRSDALVLKLDANGDVIWQKTYGGIGDDDAYSVHPTADGGYVVGGSTASFPTGGAWVLKLDASGNVIWQKTYGVHGSALQLTADGGYMVLGSVRHGDVVIDAWLLKLDTSGNVIWQKTYGAGLTVFITSVQSTADGGYIAAGLYGFKAWALKLDAGGNIIWQKIYGDGASFYTASSLSVTTDGGYILAGTTYLEAPPDAWLLKLDASGNIIWQKTYGGAGNEQGAFVRPTADGGYIVAASTSSFGAGSDDVWVLKLDANGTIAGCANVGTASAMPANTTVTPASFTAPVASSNATPASGTAFASNSFAVSQQQCSSVVATSNIPTLSDWALIVMSGVVGMCGAVLVRRHRKAWRGRA
jgi:hypothetical protein